MNMLGVHQLVFIFGLCLFILEVTNVRLIKKMTHKNHAVSLDEFNLVKATSSLQLHRNVFHRQTHKNIGRNVVSRKQLIAASSPLRQSTTEACGRTGDGQTDPFGLSAQFATSGRKRRDLDLETTEADARAFGQFSRRRIFENNNLRIIGGTTTTPSQICWQVLVWAATTSGFLQLCGGVIIGSRTILTTAACLYDVDTAKQMQASQFQIIVGAIDNGAPDTNANDPTGCAQTIQVQSITAYPSFNFELSNNDVALITLSTAIDLSNKQCACTLCLENRQPNVGERCIVSGYGFDKPSLNTSSTRIPLKWVAQTIISQDNVTACPVFQNAAGTTETDTSLFTCAGGPVGQDSCLEDQGGALACFNPSTSSHYAAGLVSFGSETCGAGLGSQHTKLSLYLQWIQQTALAGDVVVPDSATVTSTPTTSPTVTASTAPSTGEGCGLPGNGAIDPFGIVSQFRMKRKLSSVHETNLNGRRRERNRAAPRIVGGFDVTPTVICWQVYLIVDLPANGGQLTCGGIIIGSRTILTTASCLLDLDANPVAASSIFVEVGATDNGAPTTNANDPTGCAQEYTVTQTVRFPTFQFSTSNDDIALVILTEAIDLQGKACACTICLSNRVPTVGETCVMSGYGNEIANSSAVAPRDPIPLKWVLQTILSQNTATTGSCAVFQDDATGATTNVTNYICSAGAVGQDQCVGDAGGPLTCYNPTSNRYYLGGIIAFGSETCATGDGGQSVKVSNYYAWITANSPAGDVTLGDGATRPSSTTTSPLTTTSSSTAAPCGVPLNGVTDPFGLASQFGTSGSVVIGNGRNRKHKVREFSRKTDKIIGGTLAKKREICWQASVLASVEDFEQFCGGVIIGSRTILTAGHCIHSGKGVVFPATNFSVSIGALEFPPDSERNGCAASFTVTKVIPHPQFNAENLDNDIGILVLSEVISFTSGCYCPACVTNRVPVTGERCAVSGFGQTTADNNAAQPAIIPLSWVTQAVKLQTDPSCAVLTDSSGVNNDPNDFICAGGVPGQDSCFGDSGGPFACYNPLTRSHYVAGLTSFGDDLCATTTGSQYIKIAAYLDFIAFNAPTGDVQIQSSSTSSTTTTTTNTVPTVTTVRPSTVSGSTAPSVSTTAAVTAPTVSNTTPVGTSNTTYFYPTYPNYEVRPGSTLASVRTSTSGYHDYREYYPPNGHHIPGPIFPFDTLQFPHPYIG